ncbi:hypothetical protein Tco_1384118 [Tanacetum coccineum]
MDRNNVHLVPVSINTKFLNCLQPEWSKYVTMVRHNQTGDTVSYNQLYDSLVQFASHVQASKAKRGSRNHDPLALIANSNASPSQSHASSSYSHSPQPYYVIHPSSIVDYEEDYQGELQGDSQEVKLITAIMHTFWSLNEEISRYYSDNLYAVSIKEDTTYLCLHFIRNHEELKTNTPYPEDSIRRIEDYLKILEDIERGPYFKKPLIRRIDLNQYGVLMKFRDYKYKSLNTSLSEQVGLAGDLGLTNDVLILLRAPRTESNPGKANVQCYNCNDKGHCAHDFDDNAMTDPTYDVKVVSEVNASHKMIPIGVYEHKNHEKHKTVINTFDDDQLDSNIIFDDPHVENNGGSVEHDSNVHDLEHDVKSASTPVDLEKPLVKNGDADNVDVHLYRSMIGSLMYLIASRPDIMFAVYACARFQVTPKTSHLLAVKRIFRYLKGKPTLGLWYSRDSSFELIAYFDSDYAGATQDRKSTTRDLLAKGFDAGRFQYLVLSIGMLNP